MGPEVLALLIPIVAILTGGAIACTAMLIRHQKSMAEILHKNQEDNAWAAEIHALRNEVAMLKDRLNQQQIELDERRSLDQVESDLQQRH